MAPTGAGPIAKITDRFLAYLIDTLPFSAAFYATAIYLILVARRLPETASSWLLVAGAWLGLYLAYHTAGNAAGATLGKWLMGLRVARTDGSPPGLARAALRAVGLLASTPLNLGFLWAFVNRDSRAWHDLLAGTVVVEAQPKSARESRVTALAAFATLGGALALSAWAHWARPSPADLDAIARAQEGLHVLAMIQERHKEAHGSYSSSLAELAAASGDVAQFKVAMAELFDPRQFRLAASESRYSILARARDRRSTPVSIVGPPPPRGP
ncbi:MAG: RDD family protein [Elusimicrobia bacterium]|nr:RDD family protein [Elusimicrobiota bacterium]